MLQDNIMHLAFNRPINDDSQSNPQRPYFLEKDHLHINYDELLDKSLNLLFIKQ